jgi:hypothetical protein
LQVGAVVTRLWALPLFIFGWIIGVACQVVVTGFEIAWSIAVADVARGLYKGERKRVHPTPLDDDDDWPDA